MKVESKILMLEVAVMYSLSLPNLKVIIGQKKIAPLILRPFDNLVKNFFKEISKDIFSNKQYKNHKDLIYLAFFLRNQNNYSHCDKFIDSRLGRGLTLHICTENVPLNFAYSLFFGLLYGNTNLVKVPEKDFDQNILLIKILKKYLKLNKYKLLRKYIYLFKYDKNPNITDFLSSISDVRMIWGSDITISLFKRFNTKPRVVDLFFSSRKSFSIIDLDKYQKLKKNEKKLLSEKYFKDCMLFNQLGCSSPNIILWYSKNKNTRRKNVDFFWKDILSHFNTSYDIDLFQSSKRFEILNEIILESRSKSKINSFDEKFYVLDHQIGKFDLKNNRSFAGIFHQYFINNLKEISKLNYKEIQTLSVFGIDKKILLERILNNSILGIDRIVNIGESLEMSSKWDGYDLKNFLTRIIDT